MAHPHDARPAFRHIHCSSRFDRSASSLEADIDDWVKEASVITMTEVNIDKRAQQMSEEGWGFHYIPGSNPGAGDGIMWDHSVWHCKKKYQMRLSNIAIAHGTVQAKQWFTGALLKHVKDGHTLLVVVTHMPTHAQGLKTPHQHWHDQWLDRKQAYQQAMRNYSNYVHKIMADKQPDGVIVVADWNLNLKYHWVRAYMRDHWGKSFRQAWRQFPTSGGSLHGGAMVPLAAPGKGHGAGIIDGTLYHGLEVTLKPNLMAAVKSSDHRPYREAFQFNHDAGKPAKDGSEPDATGDIKPGPEWWGFGDYIDDELYTVDDGGALYPDLWVATGSKQGEVL